MSSSTGDRAGGADGSDEAAVDDEYGVLKVEDDPRSKEEIISIIAERHPIELEPRLDTLDSPVIIECASPGWQPDTWPPAEAYEELPPNYTSAGETRYPAVPCSLEDQARVIVEAAEAGCATAHIHPRDPADCLGTDDTAMLAEIYDRIHEETDVVSIQHSWELTPDGSIDYVSKAEEKLEAAGGDNRYIEGGLVLWPPFDSYPDYYTERAREGVEFYQANDVKPIYKVRSQYDARRLQRDLYEPGYMEENPIVIHDMGHPFGWPLDTDPWMPVEMVTNLEETKRRFPEALIGVASGGRNWLPITVMAILTGVDYVRIGIEDYYWMYPHRDEVIQRNMDVVEKIVGFCDIVGREVATPEQAREMLAMD
jgi:uncharacterized protein (DUF849 family)